MARGLGKGIGAFFPDTSYTQEDQVQSINVSELRPNPYQPRKTFDEAAIKELSESILEHGILQPIIVRKSIKGYEIVVGERRYRAAQNAELKTVPAVVKELTEDQMMEIALIENIQREDLNPLEEARAYQKLMEHLQVTQEELSKKLGKSRPYIANHVRLLQLPQIVQQYLSDGRLSMGHARALLSLKDKNKLTPLLQKIIKDKMSVRQLEEWIQRSNENVSRETSKNTLSPFLKDRESALKSYFGTKVQIKKGKGKGKIEIDFFTDEDLERILELLHTTEEE
ncbi:chromosome partitioning protein ParB [Salipaludibacillus neizhouensis]|uniref:Chromosome partitioning protein ParB n=1 Tax=Salipaludibacillus neizhouensis TaxID=885475 RepID=A0A3A9JYQ3_9BACI|nr:ParB/RepB/Spo0J family partition protein [Salipaludibacillus neizhouensis]RKL66024.1 chromosome partitioning protein ParB [Salipaludibacillus neizhouensis]